MLLAYIISRGPYGSSSFLGTVRQTNTRMTLVQREIDEE